MRNSGDPARRASPLDMLSDVAASGSGNAAAPPSSSPLPSLAQPADPRGGNGPAGVGVGGGGGGGGGDGSAALGTASLPVHAPVYAHPCPPNHSLPHPQLYPHPVYFHNPAVQLQHPLQPHHQPKQPFHQAQQPLRQLQPPIHHVHAYPPQPYAPYPAHQHALVANHHHHPQQHHSHAVHPPYPDVQYSYAPSPYLPPYSPHYAAHHLPQARQFPIAYALEHFPPDATSTPQFAHPSLYPPQQHLFPGVIAPEHAGGSSQAPSTQLQFHGPSAMLSMPAKRATRMDVVTSTSPAHMQAPDPSLRFPPNQTLGPAASRESLARPASSSSSATGGALDEGASISRKRPADTRENSHSSLDAIKSSGSGTSLAGSRKGGGSTSKMPREERRRDSYTRFTPEEEALLMEGVFKYGAGNWKQILASNPEFHWKRTPVDLKDKWRNLTRARQRRPVTLSAVTAAPATTRAQPDDAPGKFWSAPEGSSSDPAHVAEESKPGDSDECCRGSDRRRDGGETKSESTDPGVPPHADQTNIKFLLYESVPENDSRGSWQNTLESRNEKQVFRGCIPRPE